MKVIPHVDIMFRMLLTDLAKEKIPAIGIICPTARNAHDLMNVFKYHHIKWTTGEEPHMSNSQWLRHREATVYLLRYKDRDFHNPPTIQIVTCNDSFLEDYVASLKHHTIPVFHAKALLP